MKTLRTERELINFLRGIREQAEVPAPPAPAPAPPPAPPVQGVDPSALAQGQQPSQQPITVEDIIDKLNIVRSGRSTKDSDVKREMEEYIAQFNEDEKMALLAFLEGLGQILTSGVDSADAADPQDPYSLQIKKSLGASTANSTKTPVPNPSSAPAPAPGPVPIKIGG